MRSAHAATSMNGRIEELKHSKGLLTVAIVDDDVVVRLSLERIIRHFSSLRLVGSYAHSESALNDLPCRRPAVIFMGLLMPKPDGLKCTQRLKVVSNDWNMPTQFFSFATRLEHLFSEYAQKSRFLRIFRQLFTFIHF
jgi:DNA-binding LytR/AlgR family response regulator